MLTSRKRELLAIGIILIIQTIVFVIVGTKKEYLHMDEAYSLGLANYDKVEIQDNEDFYNNWHNKEYYEDYLAVQDKDVGKYSQVYENQKNDVHPPIYYLLLRIIMGFNKNSFSKWTGIILNIIIYAFITVFMYLILQKLFKGKPKYKEKSIIVALISSITMASLTNVIYIRMYALSTLNILITTFLHIKLLDSKNVEAKLLVLIGISALIGSLTHYYYLFYLAMLFIMFTIKYIKNKNYKDLKNYIMTMCLAGATSLIIFPYSIQHMFFGYRGQGAISNLTNISQFVKSIREYLEQIDLYAFNKMMDIIICAIIMLVIYKIIKKQKIIKEKNKYINYIIFPTLLYFILVAITSPWGELRYMMPVCSTIFVVGIYYLSEILHNTFKEKTTNIIMTVFLVVMIIMPVKYEIKPEFLYSGRKEIISKLENELNVPAIYFLDLNDNRFLDDILLFSILNESYITKDYDFSEERIKQILNNKDISNGIILFINGWQDNDSIIESTAEITGLNTCTYLERLNACDIYYLK